VAARSLLDSVEWAIAEGVRKGRPRPALASVHRAGPTPFSNYLRQQAKIALRVGAHFREVPLPEAPYPANLPGLLARLDASGETHGILLEHPLPEPWPFAEAIEKVRPIKDIDGISPTSLGLLASRRPVHVPAVVRAAVRLAEHHHLKFAGRRVGIIGRSETVGAPLAALLSGPGPHGDATVVVTHSRTPDLRTALERCEILFSCVGKANLLDRTNVPREASIIDIGLVNIPDPMVPKGYRTVGDANVAELEGWADALSPVPGGVGPVTVAALYSNLISAWEEQVGVPIAHRAAV
jgi:methylenetetrahydrofolate dehydrogenase (NADP+) / methenyltetrahydrofolate cyclohydrolase